MPLPDEFSAWEHLQSILMQSHNRIVREEFSDLGGDDWDESIATPRASLRVACTIKDDDSAIQSITRLILFYIILRKASDLHPPIYAMPTDRYQQDVKFMPQITLYFREDIDDVETGYGAIDAEISFRIRGETHQTYSEAKARVMANAIKNEFCTGGGYRWRKGRTKVNYRDHDRGYLLSINAYSESEAREVITKVLSLQGDVIDTGKLTVSTLGASPPITPPNEVIYGQTRRTPRKRPVGYVRFQWAELHLWGIPNAIVMVDRSMRRRRPLIEAT